MADGERNPMDTDVTPRDAMANLAQTFRLFASDENGLEWWRPEEQKADFTQWASRLERAVRVLDDNWAIKPWTDQELERAAMAAAARLYPSGIGIWNRAEWLRGVLQELAMAGLNRLEPVDRPLEDEKASQRP